MNAPRPVSTGTRARRRSAATALVVASAVLASACIGSGKVARASDLGPLPPGIRVVADVSSGCREGESGFDYRFVVLTGGGDLSTDSPLLQALRANGFYHSVGLADDQPWITVGYQHSRFPLRAELGPLRRYLDRPGRYQGPDPAALPTEVRDRPGDAVLVALRPTDFACSTPL
jgi:hypothetical protein